MFTDKVKKRTAVVTILAAAAFGKGCGDSKQNPDGLRPGQSYKGVDNEHRGFIGLKDYFPKPANPTGGEPSGPSGTDPSRRQGFTRSELSAEITKFGKAPTGKELELIINQARAKSAPAKSEYVDQLLRLHGIPSVKIGTEKIYFLTSKQLSSDQKEKVIEQDSQRLLAKGVKYLKTLRERIGEAYLSSSDELSEFYLFSKRAGCLFPHETASRLRRTVPEEICRETNIFTVFIPVMNSIFAEQPTFDDGRGKTLNYTPFGFYYEDSEVEAAFNLDGKIPDRKRPILLTHKVEAVLAATCEKLKGKVLTEEQLTAFLLEQCEDKGIASKQQIIEYGDLLSERVLSLFRIKLLKRFVFESIGEYNTYYAAPNIPEEKYSEKALQDIASYQKIQKSKFGDLIDLLNQGVLEEDFSLAVKRSRNELLVREGISSRVLRLLNCDLNRIEKRAKPVRFECNPLDAVGFSGSIGRYTPSTVVKAMEFIQDPDCNRNFSEKEKNALKPLVRNIEEIRRELRIFLRSGKKQKEQVLTFIANKAEEKSGIKARRNESDKYLDLNAIMFASLVLKSVPHVNTKGSPREYISLPLEKNF